MCGFLRLFHLIVAFITSSKSPAGAVWVLYDLALVINYNQINDPSVITCFQYPLLISISNKQ